MQPDTNQNHPGDVPRFPRVKCSDLFGCMMENDGVNAKAGEHMENEELVARIKAGIDTADNMLALWEQNRGMIGKLARRYSAYADIEDLQQEGYLALYDAIDGFKPDKGVRFLSYATTIIERKMRRYIYDNGSSVRIPEHEQAKMYEYKKTVNAFQMYLGRKPTRQEIAYNMGLSDKGVRELEKTVRMGQIASLDKPLADDSGTDALIDMIPDESDAMAELIDDVQKEQLKSVIWNVVDSLPGNQGAVLRARFQRGQTLKETGAELGVALERVRTIQYNGLRELRRGEKAQILRSFYDGDIYNAALHGTGAERFSQTWTSSTERLAIDLAEPREENP